MHDGNHAYVPDNRARPPGNETNPYKDNPHVMDTEPRPVVEKPLSGNRRNGSGRSARSDRTAGTVFTDTVEHELSGFSSTARMTHEDLGRIVSPPESVTPRNVQPQSRQKPNQTSNQRAIKTPNSNKHQLTKQDFEKQRQLMEIQMTTADDNLREIMMNADSVQRDLKSEIERKKTLQSKFSEADQDIKTMNDKIATIRVKLGVANANFNVSKTESEQLRRQFQEAQIKKARLDERIKGATADLGRLTDPDNPESYVNMKNQVTNDRKVIKSLKTDLEGVRGERSDVQKQIETKESKLRHLADSIAEVRGQLGACQGDLDVADVSAEAERIEREDIEVKYNKLLGEKIEYDEQMTKYKSKISESLDGKLAIRKQADTYRQKEHVIHDKILKVEKHLRDTFTELEQMKNARMPQRTASSIKYHQFRMYSSSIQQLTSTSTRIDVGSKSVYNLGSVNRATSKGSGGTMGSKATASSKASQCKGKTEPAKLGTLRGSETGGTSYRRQ